MILLSEGRDPVGHALKLPATLPALSSEIVEADLGDVRLTRRLVLLVDSLADRAGESVPEALDDAELEGADRFFGNANVTPEAILSPPFRQTARRAAAHRTVLVIHDTTHPEMVTQEIWGLLIGYNLVRLEIARTAAEIGVPPPGSASLLRSA